MRIDIDYFGVNKQPSSEAMDDGQTIFDLMGRVGVSAQGYIAAIGGELVPVDQPLNEGDRVTLIRMLKGG